MIQRAERASLVGLLLLLVALAGCGEGTPKGYDDVAWVEGVRLATTASSEQQALIGRLLEARPAVGSAAEITIDYPRDESIFPPEILSPTFLWHDAGTTADRWLIDVALNGDSSHIYVLVEGEPAPSGHIDERALSETNEIYQPTAYQASARSWKPSPEVWQAIKNDSVEGPARVTISGYSSANPDEPVSSGAVRLLASRDPVGAPIFYRDVPLMPAPTERGIIQPLAQSALPLIQWRLRDVSLSESRVVLEKMTTCANCHSFTDDGQTMAMDVDGPTGDKGSYAIAAIAEEVVIGNDQVITWNAFEEKLPGLNTLGFLSRISPDGRNVVSTVNEEIYVANFKDYRFGQVFYPTRGILAYYSRETGRIQSLPGADDAAYVHCDPVWSPDGEYIVFARAAARDAYPEGRPLARYAGDPNETPIQYDLYRIPFNDGRGGAPEPISGASANGMSNTFPKVTPDGKWVVFVQCENGQLMRPDSKLWIVPFEGGQARLMRCNTSRMNSWHSFSPNGRWMAFSSKSNTPYTQMFLTHIDAQGDDSPAVLLENSTAANRAVNLPEFVNVNYDEFVSIAVPAVEHHQYFQRGTRLAQEGQYAEAVTEFERALEGQPQAWRTNDWRIHESMSKSLLRLGRLDRARKHTLASLKLNPYNAEMHTNLGYIFTESGEYDRALEHLNLAIQLAPEFPGSWYNRGTLNLRLGDWRSALADYAQTIRIQPAYVEAFVGRATILHSQGDLRGAMADFDRAVELSPRRPDAWYGRARVRRASGDLDGALQDLDRAAQVAPAGWPYLGELESLRREVQSAVDAGA